MALSLIIPVITENTTIKPPIFKEFFRASSILFLNIIPIFIVVADFLEELLLLFLILKENFLRE